MQYNNAMFPNLNNMFPAFGPFQPQNNFANSMPFGRDLSMFESNKGSFDQQHPIDENNDGENHGTSNS
jgi:hypothetical protein